jgi:hypothetical protein
VTRAVLPAQRDESTAGIEWRFLLVDGYRT